MKVKCIKTSVANNNPQVINGLMDDYLAVGTVHWVYGISFDKGTTYVYIFNDQHLIEVPVELFEVLDDHVSDLWKFKVEDYGKVTLWPDLFYDYYFLENFSEWEQKERQKFELFRILIER